MPLTVGLASGAKFTSFLQGVQDVPVFLNITFTIETLKIRYFFHVVRGGKETKKEEKEGRKEERKEGKQR